MMIVLIAEKRIRYSGFGLTILEYSRIAAYIILNCPSLIVIHSTSINLLLNLNLKTIHFKIFIGFMSAIKIFKKCL